MPVWRTDSEDRPFSLVITAAGRKMIKAEGEPADQRAAPQKIENGKSTHSGVDATAEDGADTLVPPNVGVDLDSGRLNESSRDYAGGRAAAPRAGTKRALLIEMLSRAEGAAIGEMVEVMGWLPHTIRAALTGLRRRGFGIEHCRTGGKTTYRIVDAGTAGHAAAVWRVIQSEAKDGQIAKGNGSPRRAGLVPKKQSEDEERDYSTQRS